MNWLANGNSMSNCRDSMVSVRFMRTIIFALLIGTVIGSSSIFGQDAESDRATIEAAMKRSREITKDASYRTVTKVETGTSPTTKEWEPYSSWRIENVYPDRTHFKYTSGRTGEWIGIGRVRYTRQQNEKDEWVQGEAPPPIWVNNPSAQIGLNGPVFKFYNAVGLASDAAVTVLRVVKEPDGTSPQKATVFWTFWFDKDGILFKHDSIGYNGRNWVRNTQMYEYDPTIKIEAPIK